MYMNQGPLYYRPGRLSRHPKLARAEIFAVLHSAVRFRIRSVVHTSLRNLARDSARAS
jgi:hypothetical protein